MSARECPRHGSYSGALRARCPVCEGRSTGRTWATIVGNRRKTNDDGYVDSDGWEQTPTGRRRAVGPTDGA